MGNIGMNIVHAVPGRVRLKIERLEQNGHNGLCAEDIQQALLKVAGINEVAINQDSGNLVIRYDVSQAASMEFAPSVASALGVASNGFDAGQLTALFRLNGNGKGSTHSSGPPATSSASDHGEVAPATPEGSMAATILVHEVRGRVRLRVPALLLRPNLAKQLELFLTDQPGVAEVSVSQWTSSVTVTYDASAWTSEKLRDLLRGLRPEEIEAYTPRSAAEGRSKPVEQEVSGNELWYSSAGIGLAILAEPLLPLLPVLLLASALPMLQRAYVSVADDGKLNVDVLDASATALLVVQGNFPMALFMVWLINVADYIRDLTMMQSQKAIEEILGYQNIEAWVVRDGQKVRVAVAEIRLGETVVVYTGERITVDGTVISGRAMVDQAALTGESVPIEKEEGAKVYAATVVREGKLYVRAERIGNETEAAQIVRLVGEAPARETKIQNYAVKWANDLVPYSFIGGGVGALLGGGLPGAAAVLIVDYGTGIRIAAPTTVLSAMTKAIRNGILIKGGRHLENLAEVDAVVFDKTGTLTTGHPDILDVVPTGAYTADDVLALAAAAEMRLTHPVAEAIVRAAEARGIPIPERTASEYSLGLGVEAVVNDAVVLVGSPRFLVQNGLALSPDVERTIAEIQRRAVSPLCVAVDGAVVGLLSIADPLRPEARHVVQALRQRGIKHIVMLTGDHKDVATRVAEEIGITEFVAEVFPGDKAEAVQRLQRQGFKVAVVGDGINDSPALAYADVGIAVEGGTEAARETAPVVLLHGGLWKVPLAIDIGRETVALIQQNWKIISIPNTIALGLACIGLLGPIGSTLLSNGSAILATMNGLRPIMQGGGRRSLKIVSPRPEVSRPMRRSGGTHDRGLA